MLYYARKKGKDELKEGEKELSFEEGWGQIERLLDPLLDNIESVILENKKGRVPSCKTLIRKRQKKFERLT